MKKLLIVAVLACSLEGMQSSFNEGKRLAEIRKNGIEDEIKTGKNKSLVSDYQEGVVVSPDELSKAFEYLSKDEHGRALREIHKTRKPYILDETEPFMARGEEALQHPEKALEEGEEIEERDNYTIETCEECPNEEYLVKARKTKKRYVYLKEAPYIETEEKNCNHGHFKVRVTIPVEPEEAFLESGVWNIKYIDKTESGTDIYEHYLVNGVSVTLKKTILQNGHAWQHPGNCIMTDPLVHFVVGSPDIIRTLLSSERSESYYWGRLGRAELHPRVVNDTGEHYWLLDDACKYYEKLVEQGMCRYYSVEEDPDSDKYWMGKKVNGSWGQTVTYACRSTCKNNCASLKVRGCTREPNPECLEKIEDRCLRWKWKFKCRDRIKGKKYKFSKENLFCFGGECVDSSYESDKDMIQALGYLSILEEARKELNGTENINIFKGNAYSCTRFPLSFKDCCGCNGWGVNIGLTGCDQDSRMVARLRAEGKCVQIGTYCAEYVNVGLTKFCLRKKTVFCCFGTKFAKLLQEQGKPQLGLNFGSPEEPNCRGFTADELSRIDFSRLDLSEIVSDVMDKFKPKNGAHFAKGEELRRIQDQMKEKVIGTNKEGDFLKENIRHMTGSMKVGGY